MTPARYLRSIVLSYALLGCSFAVASAQMVLPGWHSSGDEKPYIGEVPQFDVSSVKPHKPGDGNSRVMWGQANYQAENLTLKSMIASVYCVKEWLVFGLPPWAESLRWDIDAKVSEPDRKVMARLTPEQRSTMIRGILEDRFGLVAHPDTRVQPVFLMTAMPEGAKLKQSPPLPAGQDSENAGGWSSNDGSLKANRMKMDSLAELLSYQVQRTIVDHTGLAGEYDLELKWTPEERANAGDNGTGGDTPPAIFQSLKEQLGLRLTAGKAPVATVVVDKVVPPDAN